MDPSLNTSDDYDEEGRALHNTCLMDRPSVEVDKVSAKDYSMSMQLEESSGVPNETLQTNLMESTQMEPQYLLMMLFARLDGMEKEILNVKTLVDMDTNNMVKMLGQRMDRLDKEVGDLRKDFSLKVPTADKSTRTQKLPIVNVSDDDNETISSPNSIFEKLKEHDGAFDTIPSLIRSRKGKSVCGVDYHGELPVKRLFESPTNQKPIKVIRGPHSGTPKKGNSSSPSGIDKFPKKIVTQFSKPRGHMIPREVKSCFRPTPAMDLTWEEARMSAYIFNQELDKNEELFMIGDESGTRRDFLSLTIGRDVADKILTMGAKLRTHLQKHGGDPIKVWYLPPSFSDEILRGKPHDEVISDHAKTWMPPSSDLKYVYVPILEDLVHWYLMVVDFDDYCVYKLDTWDMRCYRERRLADIAKLVKVLEKTVNLPDYDYEMGHIPRKLSAWEMKIGEGIPNLGHSRNSAVWVMQWLDMEDYFHGNVIGELDEETVRMKTALWLVMHDANKRKKDVKLKNSIMWAKIM